MADIIPLAGDAYDRSNEQQARRAIEDRIGDIESRISLLFTTIGTLALGEQDISLVNGANNDIGAGYAAYVRISGPSASFSITGISGGERGRILLIRNTTAQQMTIANQSGSSAAANRIITQTAADLVLTGANGQSAVLVYDATTERWIVFAKQESSDT